MNMSIQLLTNNEFVRKWPTIQAQIETPGVQCLRGYDGKADMASYAFPGPLYTEKQKWIVATEYDRAVFVARCIPKRNKKCYALEFVHCSTFNAELCPYRTLLYIIAHVSTGLPLIEFMCPRRDALFNAMERNSEDSYSSMEFSWATLGNLSVADRYGPSRKTAFNSSSYVVVSGKRRGYPRQDKDDDDEDENVF